MRFNRLAFRSAHLLVCGAILRAGFLFGFRSIGTLMDCKSMVDQELEDGLFVPTSTRALLRAGIAF